ncbi:DUF1707 SHOCT-like domain-containing protein [Flammeovirga kamogawensis]|uniref:DUF1707 domain-containing protein n=1 Tax=Flammeovirga kamogawensis TaxID=373891 RepID=A0ABX8GYD1_9BACT|nr:DUF1707 domain-containing protein [Flammeovirga kamogawensis]MBB6459053.1 hypothetical protein [Flammeovirga kamogawensis]QWG08623.1 DUF1707 domain-containing protein [Flammeovirga kamogawensis]TRX66916.1 DUF1707 domain-containing protein [Flammeovirga kamogawensis]
MKHSSQFGLPKKRQKALDLLQKAFSDGDLDENDYENRLDLAMKADSEEALKLVFSDFPDQYVNQITSSKAVGKPTSANKLVVNQNVDKLSLNILGGKDSVIHKISEVPSRFFTIVGEQKLSFSSEELTNAEASFEIVTVVGETKIDLRAHCLEGAVLNLRLTKVLGEVNIKVAKGTHVVDHTKKVLSEYKYSLKSKSWSKIFRESFSSYDEDASVQSKEVPTINCTVILEGLCVLGSVNIKEYDV